MKQCSWYLVMTLLLLLHSCGTRTVQGGGGTTETVGFVFTAEGIPAQGTHIIFVPADHNPQFENTPLDTTVADSLGRFSFADLADGEYNVMYQKDSLKAFRKSLLIADGEVSVDVSDTLRSTGSIEGIVTHEMDDSADEIFILINGSNRFVKPDAQTGTFMLDSLAVGSYSVTFITKKENYGYIDTILYVIAGQNDALTDTLVIPYIGIETPKNFALRYDTLLQQTMVSWSPVQSSSLGSYQLCRRRVGDTSCVQIFRVTDTQFIDSCDGDLVLQNSLYEYTIATVDKDGRCGTPSAAQSVAYSSSIGEGKSLTLTEIDTLQYGSIISDGKGTLYAVCSDSALFFVIDENSLQIRNRVAIPDKSKPYDIALLTDSTLMISGERATYNVTTDGEMLWRYDIQSPCIATVGTELLYYTQRAAPFSDFNSIYAFNVEKGIKECLFQDDSRTIAAFTVADGYIYIAFTADGKVTLERSAIDFYNPRIIYESIGKYGSVDVAVDDTEITLLISGRVVTFDKNSLQKKRHAIVENARYICGIGDAFACLTNYGALQMLQKRQNHIRQTMKQ